MRDVPYYSQYRDIKDKDWQPRACGLVCLKMILDFYEVDTPEINQFLKVAIERKSFGKSGWIHDKFLELAKSYSLEAFRKEFNDTEEGIRFIIDFLQQTGPVIVSLKAKKFLPEFENKFHQIVLTDYNTKGFYYNDPDYLDEEGKNLFVKISDFKKYWRKLAIFIQN